MPVLRSVLRALVETNETGNTYFPKRLRIYGNEARLSCDWLTDLVEALSEAHPKLIVETIEEPSFGDAEADTYDSESNSDDAGSEDEDGSEDDFSFESTDSDFESQEDDGSSEEEEVSEDDDEDELGSVTSMSQLEWRWM